MPDQNYRVYRRDKADGEQLIRVGQPVMADGPEQAVVLRATQPGEYLVFTLDFSAVWRVQVTYYAEEVSS